MRSLKTIFVFTILFIFSISLSTLGQDVKDSTAHWKTPVIIDFTTTQAAYSDSWVGGEAGSVNWASNLNGSAQKQINPKFNFKSTLKLSFGQTLTQNAETKDWSKPKKSTDLIDWETVGRFTLNFFVDPYTAFRLESQFYDGSNIAKKLFLNPIKFTESAGFAKKLYTAESNEIITRLGLGIRQLTKTVIIDAALNTDDSTFTDGGFESVTDATFKFNDHLTYTGKLSLYRAIYFSKSDAVKGTEYEDDWKALDINWENIVNAQLSKVITVNFYAQFLYDKEISKKARIKETMAIGFVYKLF